MTLCDCGHEQDRHAGTSGPCLRCNCSGYAEETEATVAADVSDKDIEKAMAGLVKTSKELA